MKSLSKTIFITFISCFVFFFTNSVWCISIDQENEIIRKLDSGSLGGEVLGDFARQIMCMPGHEGPDHGLALYRVIMQEEDVKIDPYVLGILMEKFPRLVASLFALAKTRNLVGNNYFLNIFMRVIGSFGEVNLVDLVRNLLPPGDVYARINLVRMVARAGEWERAGRVYDGALGMMGEQFTNVENRDIHIALVFGAHIDALFQRGDIERAAAFFLQNQPLHFDQFAQEDNFNLRGTMCFGAAYLQLHFLLAEAAVGDRINLFVGREFRNMENGTRRAVQLFVERTNGAVRILPIDDPGVLVLELIREYDPSNVMNVDFIYHLDFFARGTHWEVDGGMELQMQILGMRQGGPQLGLGPQPHLGLGSGGSSSFY